MKKADKFNPKYRMQLLANIENLTKYLEGKTSYKIELDVESDKNTGFVYSAKISLDKDFSTFSKFLLYSTGKQNLKNELLENIAHFDFRRNRKLGSTVNKKFTRQVKSSALRIDCHACGKDVAVCEIHRNISSPIFKQREGYCFTCLACSNANASAIKENLNAYPALIYLCALYDRPFLKKLADDILELNLPDKEIFGQYFRRLNLISSVKNGKNTFGHSDIFDIGEVND